MVILKRFENALLLLLLWTGDGWGGWNGDLKKHVIMDCHTKAFTQSQYYDGLDFLRVEMISADKEELRGLPSRVRADGQLR